MFIPLLSTVAVFLVFGGVIAVFNGPIKTALVALEERCDRWEDPLSRRKAKEKS